MITVGFVALGCPKNIVDSEKMLANMGQAGLVLSGDPDCADVVVINTCGFIEPAKEEAIAAIAQAVEQKIQGNVQKVIVTGCLAQRMGEDLLDEVGGIDAIVGLGQRDEIAKIVKDIVKIKRKNPRTYLKNLPDKVSDDSGRLLITPGHWAYLRISEGCNRRCSFCTIPSIRGAFRSKEHDAIVAEAVELVENGAVELSIIAQDSNFYGRDKGIKNGLVKLVGDLERIEGLEWIRLMYLYPAGVDDELIEAIAKSEKVVNYVDIPVQHINNDILKSMKRIDTKEKTVSLIEKLRAAMPDVVLRTTVIVGYPGETEEQFGELLDLIKWARFDALGCFTFYPEPGTVAATLDGQVAEEVKEARADAVMETQQQIAFEKIDSMVGSEVVCLIDDGEDAVGRYYGQAPHVDSICFIDECSGQPGDIIRAEVTGRDGYDLLVRQISD